jgi:hypothetical protein
MSWAWVLRWQELMVALEIGGGDCLTKTHNSAKRYLEVLSLTSARHLYINTIVDALVQK